VVEDQEDNRKILRDLLTSADYVERRLVITKHAEEGEPAPVQVAPSIADEQTVNDPMPGKEEPAHMQVAPSLADEQNNDERREGETEPVRVASSVADEQTVNEPMPGEGDVAARIAPASGLIRRVMAKVRGR
jgi:hypothetical protein